MKKPFDCVEMMRDIRAKLSRRYTTHPELLEQDMARVRRSYGFPEPERKPQAQVVAEAPAEYRAPQPH
jgi:hypothetical protein